MKTNTSKGGHVRRNWYKILCEEDGEKCQICGRKPPEVYLEVDHINRNTRDNRRANLRLLCKRDNRLAPNGGRGKGKRKQTGVSIGILDKEKATSAELAINRQAEPEWRHWMEEEVLRDGQISVEDAIYSGAEHVTQKVVSISPETVRQKYLKKLCSKRGRFMITHDIVLDAEVIVFRDAGKMLGLSADMFEKMGK